MHSRGRDRNCKVLLIGREEAVDSTVRAQVIEAAFKNETVGLVTREEFLNKRNTLQARQDEEEARVKRAAEAAVLQVCRAKPPPGKEASCAVHHCLAAVRKQSWGMHCTCL